MRNLFNIICPNCGKENIVDNGDVADDTVCDVDNFKCWNCHKAYSLFSDDIKAEDEIIGEEAVYIDCAQRPASETEYIRLARCLVHFSTIPDSTRELILSACKNIVSTTTTQEQKDDAVTILNGFTAEG